MYLSNNKLIIIIDDDEDDCYFVQLSLQKSHPDYEVLALTDSLHAVEQLQALQEIPRLILLDLHMPLSGEYVLAQIKELHQYDSVPIAVLSSVVDPNTITTLNRMGVTYVVEKPNDLGAVSTILTELLS